MLRCRNEPLGIGEAIEEVRDVAMIITQVWESNRTRCKGRFNLIFFWMYVLFLPAMLVWDALEWIEAKLS